MTAQELIRRLQEADPASLILIIYPGNGVMHESSVVIFDTDEDFKGPVVMLQVQKETF